jgi:SAM-dependent methyltransferase
MTEPSSGIRLGEAARRNLRCPCCGDSVNIGEFEVVCLNSKCSARFPIVADVPILIDEKSSLFELDEIIRLFVYLDEPEQEGVLDKLLRKGPSSVRNIHSEENYRKLTSLIRELAEEPSVMVVGGGELGKGMEPLVQDSAIDLLETDVKPGRRTNLIFDCHNIPFADGSFDTIILQAVLEHVIDPVRCVSEVYRVLKDGGIVYSEVPGVQQVHEGSYDFMRFTHLGHRRLFRWFDEIASGPTCGPAMAFVWALQFLVMSFVRRRGPSLGRRFVELLTRAAFAWITRLDRFIIDTPASYDAASAYYFMGRKSPNVLSDRELVKGYRGCYFGPS